MGRERERWRERKQGDRGIIAEQKVDIKIRLPNNIPELNEILLCINSFIS
jgi:hypothetical protein